MTLTNLYFLLFRGRGDAAFCHITLDTCVLLLAVGVQFQWIIKPNHLVVVTKQLEPGHTAREVDDAAYRRHEITGQRVPASLSHVSQWGRRVQWTRLQTQVKWHQHQDDYIYLYLWKNLHLYCRGWITVILPWLASGIATQPCPVRSQSCSSIDRQSSSLGP